MRDLRAGPAFLVVIVVLVAGSCGGDDATAPTTTGSSSTAPSTTGDDRSPDALPEVAAFTVEDVTVGRPPVELGGTLRIPEGASSERPAAGVVIVHGFGPNDRDGTRLALHPYRDLAEGLADEGIATLTYDKRTNAYADSFLGAEYTLDEEVVDDAVAAVDLLREQPAVDDERIFLVGHGLGAMSSPRIAARTPVAGLVLLDPPSRPLAEVVVDRVEHLAGVDGEVTAEEQAELDEVRAEAAVVAGSDLESVDPGEQLLGHPAVYWLDLREYDPVAALADLGVAALVLHGGRSYEVTDADFERWADAAEADDRLRAERLPDLNHYFVAGSGPSSPDEYARAAVVDPEVVDEVAAFVG